MEENDLHSRVCVLEEQNTNQFKTIGELKGLICSLSEDIKNIREKLIGRPSWWVVILITGLFTVCTGLAMFVITGK